MRSVKENLINPVKPDIWNTSQKNCFFYYYYWIVYRTLTKYKGVIWRAKRNIVLCICAMQCKVQKTHYFPHTVHYCCLSLPCLSEMSIFTKLIFLKCVVCSDWPAIQCIVIGWIPQAFEGNVMPLTIFGNVQHLHDIAAAATILQRE